MHENQKQITAIGKVNFRNDNRVFGIKDKDRLNHIYCLGKSGTGKSTLLLNMAIQDIENGKGMALIDPHGDLAEEILNYIPKDRISDVIYFNPSDIDYPIAFNPLRNVHPDFQHLTASGLISTFKKIWADNWGPRLEHILKFSILTILEFGHGTLLDIQPLLTNTEYRHEILNHIKSKSIKDFWDNEYHKMPYHLRSEAIAPILNKMGVFGSSEHLRSILGQRQRSFYIEKVMDEGKILIVNLSKGKLGEDVSTILGSILVTSIQLAALQRASQEEHTRRPFYLYIDECHTFLTESIAQILSESRKYALSLFLTHQYIDQLPESIKQAVFGNVGTLICFRVGATDAKYLSQEFYPVFTDIDLINLPRYSMYLKLMINGETSQAFSAESISKPKNTQSNFIAVIETSRKEYSKRTKIQAEGEIGITISSDIQATLF